MRKIFVSSLQVWHRFSLQPVASFHITRDMTHTMDSESRSESGKSSIVSVFPGEEDQLVQTLGLDKTAIWETNPVFQKHLRREHVKRGGEYIMNHTAVWGVPVNLVSALDLMMKSHNYSISELERDIGGSFAAQERVIDVRQLAIIVCVADAIEFSDTSGDFRVSTSHI